MLACLTILLVAELLFHLRHVADDEAEEVRQLLREAQIDTYETSAGSWGLGVAAIWLQDECQSAQAHAILEDYHQRRQQSARQNHVQLSHWQFWMLNPWRSLLFILLVVLVLGLTIFPFIYT